MAICNEKSATTSLTQSFSTNKDVGSILMIESETSLPFDKRVDIFVTPGTYIETVVSTYGEVISLGQQQRSFETSFLWSNESEKDVGNPNPNTIEITPIGSFIKASTGSTLTPSFYYDQELKKIRSSTRDLLYGASILKYKANGYSYRIKFPEIAGGIDISSIPDEFIVVAITNEKNSAALTLTKGEIGIKFTENGSESLSLGIEELGEQNAFAISAIGAVKGVSLKVYPYPNQPYRAEWFAFNSGEKLSISDPIGKDNTSQEQIVVDYLMFTNSNKVNIRYPPIGVTGNLLNSETDFEIVAISEEFIRDDGKPFNPSFLRPGEYQILDDKSELQLGRTQIAVMDEAGSAVNATGSIKVIYKVASKKLHFFVPYTYGKAVDNFDAKLGIAITVRDGIDNIVMSGEVSVKKSQANLSNRKKEQPTV